MRGRCWSCSEKGYMMIDYTKEELEEAHRALTSTLHKCEMTQESPMLGTSQRTLLERRIAALRISLALLEEKLEGKPISQ